jgi:hypothetical protein
MGAADSALKNVQNQDINKNEKYQNDIKNLNRVVKYYKHDDMLELKKMLEYNKIIELDDNTVKKILEKYSDVFKVIKSDNGAYVNDTDAAIYDYFKNNNQVADSAKSTIQNSININENFKKGLTSLIDNTSDLNKKYKYFQYKYIELNLFFMAFVSNIQSVMDSYTAYVQFTEKAKFEELMGAIDATFESMKSVVDDSDGSNSDAETLKLLSKQFKERVIKSHEETIKSLDDKTKASFQSMMAYLKANEKDSSIISSPPTNATPTNNPQTEP